MKKVALISTFCDTVEKIQVLRETVSKLREIRDLDIIAIGPRELEIDHDIVENCDFFFYTKENPLLVWPARAYTHWKEVTTSEGVTTLHRGLPDYGWAALYQVKKLSQIALTFDYDIFYHLIYDLEIDEVIQKELSEENKTNLIHPRINPRDSNVIWEATLHLMSFDRETMIGIEKEITLEEYQRQNGVAEGEVVKWRDKFNLQTSDYPVKDRIFYWEDYDFFDHSPFPEFKMFVSKNEDTTTWLGYDNPYEVYLSSNLRIVFHSFDSIEQIEINLNDNEYSIDPQNWKIEEFPIGSQEIHKFQITYKSETVDFTNDYKKIMRNLIYYNYR